MKIWRGGSYQSNEQMGRVSVPISPPENPFPGEFTNRELHRTHPSPVNSLGMQGSASPQDCVHFLKKRRGNNNLLLILDGPVLLPGTAPCAPELPYPQKQHCETSVTFTGQVT